MINLNFSGEEIFKRLFRIMCLVPSAYKNFIKYFLAMNDGTYHLIYTAQVDRKGKKA